MHVRKSVHLERQGSGSSLTRNVREKRRPGRKEGGVVGVSAAMDTNKTHRWTARQGCVDNRLTLSNVDRAKVRRPHPLHQDAVYYNREGQLQRRMNVQVE